MSTVPYIESDVMFHFIIAVIALSSASILFAHAVEAYLVRDCACHSFQVSSTANASFGDNPTTRRPQGS
jgi:hypothetical protein